MLVFRTESLRADVKICTWFALTFLVDILSGVLCIQVAVLAILIHRLRHRLLAQIPMTTVLILVILITLRYKTLIRWLLHHHMLLRLHLIQSHLRLEGIDIRLSKVVWIWLIQHLVHLRALEWHLMKRLVLLMLVQGLSELS